MNNEFDFLLVEDIAPITKEELAFFIFDHSKEIGGFHKVDKKVEAVIDTKFFLDRLWETIDLRYNQLLLKEAFDAGFTATFKSDNPNRLEE